MIGMNQIKKRLIHGILIGLGVGIVGIIIVLIVTNNIISGYEKGTSEKFNQQYMTKAYTLSRDVIQGERITDDMVWQVDVPKTALPAEAELSLGNIVGKIARYNLPSNVAVTTKMFGDYVIGKDVRIQEVNALVLPSDIAVGDYVDIRLTVPSGIEYVVLVQKRVEDIIGNTIKLDLSDEEIFLLNSAIVDSYLTDGSKLYAVKYTDPDTQIKTDEQAMVDAKDYITQKITEELIANGAISLNAQKEAQNIVEGITAATDDGSVVAATGENAVQVNKDKYIISTSTLKADKLVEIVTEYAKEYRYFVESYGKVERTYQPNDEVMRYMTLHDDILEIAKESLNADARRSMELSIINFESKTGEEYEKIVGDLEASISEQKALRGAALGEQPQ